ncbi:MAG TPA: hypothetical protein VMU99_02250 [Acidimicrobiales bacterium]|nr:hypothetical protein [Acidimicrobiales bacterium]
MKQTIQQHTNQHGVAIRQGSIGRITAVALMIGGFALPVFAASTAGAVTSHATTGLVISTIKNKTLGTILVSSGKTLYTLKASKVGCTAECTKIWPEVVLPKGVTKATAGSGCKAAQLGTVKRASGVRQVTFNGKALYRFSGDKSAGQVHGNRAKDSWGTWSVVVTAKVTSSGASAGSGGGTTTTTSGGGYGY